MHIGVQISSVRVHLQTPADLRSSLLKAARIGYRHIQMQWQSPDIPDGYIKDALAEAGLTCLGTQDYTHEVLPALARVIAQNKLWGGRYVCVSGIPEAQMSLEGCRAFARTLAGVSARLQDEGLVLQFHPRAAEFASFGGARAVEILMQEIPAHFQMEIDVYHVQKAGLSPAEWIRRMAGRMDVVHLKDMASLNPADKTLTPVGQGALAWPDILSACRDAGVVYLLAEQESWAKDPFMCLKESYDFLQAALSR